jgi:hypothetical protein
MLTGAVHSDLTPVHSDLISVHSEAMKSQHQNAISRGMSFPLQPVVQRFTSDYRVSLQDAKALERELKRFLILSAIHPTKSYGMMGPVDDLWHTFLLFTHLYAQFCEQVAGHFIHHVPEDPQSGPAEKRAFRRQYAAFLKDYQTVFAEPPPPWIWLPLETGRAVRKNPRPRRRHANRL